jgi:ribosomal protein S1
MNMERVEEALRSVNGLIARGMDWGDIERLIEHERSRGNPVAEIILKCMFKEGKIILGLREVEDDEDDEDDEDKSWDEMEEDEVEEQKDKGPVVEIEVDLGLSAWANTRTYFDQKRFAAEKVQPCLAKVLLGF